MSQNQTEITLYNTLSRSKQPFAPIDPRNVRMYVCGPTVYDRAHIGNARPVVVFDVLFRLLRHVYGPEHVTYVRNVTDVDDKINARAAAEKRPIRELTDETLAAYHSDMAALGALHPTHEPRATEFIPQMIAMVETLVARGHAYEAQGHVLFSVASWADYGRFANRSLDEMQAGARVEVAPYKRDPMDFVLWKPSISAEPGWPSPWGPGRPGWHLECSTMSHALLGASFDIHGGGIDLVFPHHQNEIAQSLCAHPEGDFARFWLHNGFLNVEGEKMSKSLGNFFTVRDLLDRGVPGEVIRFVLLSTHYRQPMDFTEAKVHEAQLTLRKWAELGTLGGDVDEEFIHALSEDLNTWEAIDRLNEVHATGDARTLTRSAELLGFDLIEISRSDWAMPYMFVSSDNTILFEGQEYQPTVGVVGWGPVPDDVRDAALEVVRCWLRLRRERNWKEADALRSNAAMLGAELRAEKSAGSVNAGVASLQSRIDADRLRALVE